MAVLGGVITPAAAWSGFANGTIVLIVVAFLVARAVVKCGLGERIGHAVVQVFGRSTLGLAYSLFLVDAVIAPAFPSNTARSGVLYSLAVSLAADRRRAAGDPSRARLGALPDVLGHRQPDAVVGALAHRDGRQSRSAPRSRVASAWRSGSASGCSPAAVPTLIAMALLPWVLYKVMTPEVTATPDAPAAARKALAALGPLKTQEWIVTATFLVMVGLWGAGATLGIDATAVAFLGLGVFLATGVLTADDIAKEGDVLATFIWFALLFAHEQPAERARVHVVRRRAARARHGTAGRGWWRASRWCSPTSCCTCCS